MVWEAAVGCSIQRTSPVALNVCSKEFAVDAPSSFRVVQGHRKDVCFLCTHPVSERDGQRLLKDPKLWACRSSGPSGSPGTCWAGKSITAS